VCVRFYVQPQWVFDCINARLRLKEADYFMGADLPAHLSPFVEEKEGDYMPPERQLLLFGKRVADDSSTEKASDKEAAPQKPRPTVEEKTKDDDEDEDEEESSEEDEEEEEENSDSDTPDSEGMALYGYKQ
jgi:pescadillo protein